MPKTLSRAAIAAAVTAAALVSATHAPASAEPGGVLAVEPRPVGWHGMSRGSVVEYTTLDSAGVERPASGALFLPEGDAPATGWPIIAYDHGTLGSGPGCGGQADPDLAPLPVNRAAEDALIQGLVEQGFAVVAPDYLGLGRFDTGPHPYLEVRSEATATIDLVRAARAATPELSRTWSVVGASQGGHAALGTAHLQASYAPELDFRGTVAVDPASDVEKALPLLGPWFPEAEGAAGLSAFTVSILAGLRATHPEAVVPSPLHAALVAQFAAGGVDFEAVTGFGQHTVLNRQMKDALADFVDRVNQAPPQR